MGRNNRHIYYVIEDLGNTIIVKNQFGEKLEKPMSKSLFDLAFACTVYKYQGDKIEEKYNIWELQQMDFNEAYTAITRATKLSDICLRHTSSRFYPAKEPDNSTHLNMEAPKIGYIYYMYNDEAQKGYIGMTINSIEKRFDEHKKYDKDPMHQFAGEWKVKEVAKVHYFSEKKLKQVEARYIEKFYFEGGYELTNTLKMPKEYEPVKTDLKIGNIDEELKKKFDIKESGNGKCGSFTIRVRSKDIQVKVVRKFTNEKGKERAFKAITEEQEKLIQIHKI